MSMSGASTSDTVGIPALSRRLVTRGAVAIGIFLVATVCCFTIWQSIFYVLASPYCAALIEAGRECTIIYTSPGDAFVVTYKSALIGALALSGPFIALQFWHIVAPKLAQGGQSLRPVLATSILLHLVALGGVYFYWMPIFVQRLTGHVPGVDDLAMTLHFPAEDYIQAILTLTVAACLVIQVPVYLSLRKREKAVRVHVSEVFS